MALPLRIEKFSEERDPFKGLNMLGQGNDT